MGEKGQKGRLVKVICLNMGTMKEVVSMKYQKYCIDLVAVSKDAKFISSAGSF